MTHVPAIAKRFEGIELSLIRQINALATGQSVNLGIGEPNLEPDDELLEMARAAATSSWRYSANAGDPATRRALASTLPVAVDPDTSICLTAGTEEGLYSVMQAFIDTGDEVLVPNPGFLAYPTLVTLAGGTAIPYSLDPDGWQIDITDLESRITPRTRAILVNSPSNPTGAVITKETIEHLVGLAEERDLLVIADEVYAELFYGEKPPSFLGKSENVVVLSGMSKSHGMTGLRIGWVIAAESAMRTIVRAHQYVATCASVFSQELMKRVLENHQWNRGWLERARAQFLAQRDAICSDVHDLLDVDVPPPGGAFYLFVPMPACSSVALAKELATDASVLAIPGAAFGSSGEGFIRLSYATGRDRIRLGVERIAAHIRKKESCARMTS